jgi:hypothetical protein
MGYAFCYSACIGCNRTFSYNPVRVPSIRVNGVKEPICRSCVERANPERIKKGLAPFVPAPDAYEPVDEQELP